ncbi:hypothetical protein B0A48_13603 [Cryoendolithus antarcticus]|uniref:Uncharacterized protein n=1 Tax=Cryoendolithus antarcticus TaxID=1507870 RepID=A0A1V8SPE0_9PEZI|nr:hypothetical protein B0A48_13603 [Cryoendolithus antarcticus]
MELDDACLDCVIGVDDTKEAIRVLSGYATQPDPEPDRATKREALGSIHAKVAAARAKQDALLAKWTQIYEQQAAVHEAFVFYYAKVDRAQEEIDVLYDINEKFWDANGGPIDLDSPAAAIKKRIEEVGKTIQDWDLEIDPWSRNEGFDCVEMFAEMAVKHKSDAILRAAAKDFERALRALLRPIWGRHRQAQRGTRRYGPSYARQTGSTEISAAVVEGILSCDASFIPQVCFAGSSELDGHSVGANGTARVIVGSIRLSNDDGEEEKRAIWIQPYVCKHMDGPSKQCIRMYRVAGSGKKVAKRDEIEWAHPHLDRAILLSPAGSARVSQDDHVDAFRLWLLFIWQYVTKQDLPTTIARNTHYRDTAKELSPHILDAKKRQTSQPTPAGTESAMSADGQDRDGTEPDTTDAANDQFITDQPPSKKRRLSGKPELDVIVIKDEDDTSGATEPTEITARNVQRNLAADFKQVKEQKAVVDSALRRLADARTKTTMVVERLEAELTLAKDEQLRIEEDFTEATTESERLGEELEGMEVGVQRERASFIAQMRKRADDLGLDLTDLASMLSGAEK